MGVRFQQCAIRVAHDQPGASHFDREGSNGTPQSTHLTGQVLTQTEAQYTKSAEPGTGYVFTKFILFVEDAYAESSCFVLMRMEYLGAEPSFEASTYDPGPGTLSFSKGSPWRDFIDADRPVLPGML